MAKQMITVKVEGLKELEGALRQLPKALSRRAMQDILVKAGQPVADHASGIAPKRSGELQKSIAVSPHLTKRQQSQSPKISDVEAYIGVGKSLPQGIFMEFGTSHHGPKPFMRPAWDAKWRSVLEEIKKNMWAVIAKTAERAGRVAGI